jgi:hypothetical protein
MKDEGNVAPLIGLKTLDVSKNRLFLFRQTSDISQTPDFFPDKVRDGNFRWKMYGR